MSLNTVCPQVMSGKTESSLLNKYKNTGPTDQLNLAVRLICNYIPQKVNKNGFIVSIPKFLHGKFPTLQLQHFGYT